MEYDFFSFKKYRIGESNLKIIAVEIDDSNKFINALFVKKNVIF